MLIILLITVSAQAQWSGDSTVNLPVCVTAGEQSVQKLVKTSDGGCYIAWFDSRSSGYAVYLQKLSSAGIKQFDSLGLLVSNKPQNSSLVDWDITVDDSNNCILVFTDIRAGGAINPYAYKISGSGAFLWGPDGIALTDSTAVYQPNPKVAKTSDGNFVITWVWGSTPQKIAIQKLSPNGTKLLGSSPYRIGGLSGETFTYPSLVSSDNGAVIMEWSAYTGSFLSPQNYKIYCLKFVTPDVPLWSNPRDTVYSLGRITGFFVPKIISDGNNGVIFAWQDDRNSSNVYMSYVQHISSTGVKLLQENGVAVTTTPAQNHFDCGIGYMPSTQEIYAIYKITNSGQTQMGLGAQKISSSGTRGWTDAGKIIVPLTSGYSTVNQLAFCKDTSALFVFNQTGSANTNYIYAFRTDRNGNYSWSSGIKGMATSASSKSKITAEIYPSGMLVAAWYDGRNSDFDIYAQNILFNGTLGIPTGIKKIYSEQPQTFSLSQNYPNPFNSMTYIKFQMLNSDIARITVYDLLGREVTTLVNEILQPGTYQLKFDASSLSSGVYYYKLTVPGFSDTKKMIIIK